MIYRVLSGAGFSNIKACFHPVMETNLQKQNKITIYMAYCLSQWFLTFLNILNPASFISAFTEPFVIGKIKYDFFK